MLVWGSGLLVLGLGLGFYCRVWGFGVLGFPFRGTLQDKFRVNRLNCKLKGGECVFTGLGFQRFDYVMMEELGLHRISMKKDHGT